MKKIYERPEVELICFEIDEEILNNIGGNMGTSGDVPDDWE